MIVEEVGLIVIPLILYVLWGFGEPWRGVVIAAGSVAVIYYFIFGAAALSRYEEAVKVIEEAPAKQALLRDTISSVEEKLANWIKHKVHFEAVDLTEGWEVHKEFLEATMAEAAEQLQAAEEEEAKASQQVKEIENSIFSVMIE